MQIKITGLLACGLIASLPFLDAHSAVLRVPADFAGIQQAIDSSQDGDVVLVSPGTYQERIDFRGKGITVTSTNAEDAEVVGRTVIHGSGQGSVVTFASGESAASVLAGLTISGGYGTIYADLSTNVWWGGGIYCNGASPTIKGNHITGNAGPADELNLGYGSGIACINSDALITGNLIAANSGYAGAGVLTYLGKVRITSNLICSNSALIAGAAAILGTGQFVNNTVVGNAAEVGSVYASSDETLRATIDGNIICNATKGGGILLEAEDSATLVAFNNVWNNAAGGNYSGGTDLSGLNGNISQNPVFVDAAANNYQLQDASPCVNQGDPLFQSSAEERDFYGNVRVYAGRVDIGASEYYDSFRPIAEAGPDQQPLVSAFPVVVTLDGSASFDPTNAALSYLWTQVGGPAVTLNGADTAKPWFTAAERGIYLFKLIVNNGSFDSLADTVQITVKNDAPVADAGSDQIFSESAIPSISLDGSQSSDPENAALSYRWRQVSGWKLELSDANAVNPTLSCAWPGVYVFELVVNDGMQDSQPDQVTIGIGPNHAPVANAGPTIYAETGKVTLDGTRSYDPDGYGTLIYAWRQVSGPQVTLTATNSAHPVMSGYALGLSIQRCVFELMVSDGHLTSLPSSVTVTIVPYFGSNALTLSNPPFDPERPTIVAFGGGNCSSGNTLTFGGVWAQQANWITVQSYAPPYAKYGDMLMVYLSEIAPDYKKPIQTIGTSTGNLPAVEVARYVNATYKDPRFAVNRVAMLDAVCNNLSSAVAQFHANPVAGEPCWVDNYISNAKNYSKASFIPGALNVECNPSRTHSYPVNKYKSSSPDYDTGGRAAFAYLSVIGKGKKYELNTAANKYYFRVNSSEAIVLFSPTLYPGETLAPVQLAGPSDGHILNDQGATLGCETVKKAVRYQLLFGFDPDRVMDFSVISESTAPPAHVVSTLPSDTWWTVRAYDQFNSSIYADPRLIRLPENHPPAADAGFDLLLFAGVDGKAIALLNGSSSTDPDGDTLACTWAWAVDGNTFQTNSMSPTLELPPGVHTIQLMVNDGRVNSEPDEVQVTVVAPLECPLKITPSAVNLRSKGPHILARLQFPNGVKSSDLKSSEPLLIHPAGAPALKRWADVQSDQLSLFAFFGKDTVIAPAGNESTELMVAGRLRSGQWFYGIDTVKIVPDNKASNQVAESTRPAQRER